MVCSCCVSIFHVVPLVHMRDRGGCASQALEKMSRNAQIMCKNAGKKTQKNAQKCAFFLEKLCKNVQNLRENAHAKMAPNLTNHMKI